MKKIPIILVLFIFFGCIRYDGSKVHIKGNEIKGIIVNVFQEKKNHNMYTFKIKVNKDTIERCAEFWPRSWEYSKVGDSIIKPKDTLMLIIKKPTGKFKKFYYKF